MKNPLNRFIKMRTFKRIGWLLGWLVLWTACSHSKEQVTHHPNGKIYESFVVLETKDGPLRHGPYQRFDEQGQLLESSTYVHGKIHGTRTLYADGKMLSKEMRANDQYEGPYASYHPNGNLQMEAVYTQDVMSGPVKVYYPSGKLKEVVAFEDNVEKGPFKEYYENGNVKAEGFYEQMEGPVEHGELKLYDSTGVLMRIMLCDFGKCKTTWKKDSSLIMQ